MTPITIDISSSMVAALSFNFVFIFLSAMLLWSAYVVRGEKALTSILIILGIYMLGVVLTIDLDVMGIIVIKMVD